MRIGDEQFVQDMGSIFDLIGETDERFDGYNHHYNYRCFNAFFLGVKYGLRDVMPFDVELRAYQHWLDNPKYYREHGVYKEAFPRFATHVDKDLS